MIALTQEKREELAHRLETYIKSAEIHIKAGLAIEEDLFNLKVRRIALASLTAEPVLYAVDSDVEDKIYTALCNENEDGAYSLFTAPPVPEVKLPPEFNESHDSFNEFRRGWNGAISEVKRINGLGE